MINPNFYDPYNMKDGYKAPEQICRYCGAAYSGDVHPCAALGMGGRESLNFNTNLPAGLHRTSHSTQPVDIDYARDKVRDIDAPEPIEIDPGESKQVGRHVLKNTGSQKVYVATGHSNPEPSVDEELHAEVTDALFQAGCRINKSGVDAVVHVLTNRIEAAKQGVVTKLGDNPEVEAGKGFMVLGDAYAAYERLRKRFESTNKQGSK